jgi:fatty acid desaturase
MPTAGTNPASRVTPAAGLTRDAASPDAATATGARRGTEYAQLSRLIRQAGLMRRRPRYYAWKIAVTATLLLLGWLVFVLVGNSWWTLAVAAFLGIMFTQMGFLGHDAGHRQITGSRKLNYLIGILHGNLGIGLSYGWWVDKHNRHHAHPNTEGADPDIQMAVLAFSEEQSRRTGWGRRVIFRYQAWLFFPMLLLEAISLHTASIRAVLSRAGRHGPAEITLLATHLVTYLAAVITVLPPGKALAFIALQQGLFGLYLGCSFAPNHKGMEILPAGDKTGYLRRQVLTSRNVRGGWLTDLALGGLNYQIEHHLFPSMPRPNLRRSQAIVRAHCRQLGLPYTETSLAGSYAAALQYLNAVGRA